MSTCEMYIKLKNQATTKELKKMDKFLNYYIEKFKKLNRSLTAAGQSIFHCHVHLIPRYTGDVANPRGGVRGVIPERQNY